MVTLADIRLLTDLDCFKAGDLGPFIKHLWAHKLLTPQAYNLLADYLERKRKRPPRRVSTRATDERHRAIAALIKQLVDAGVPLKKAVHLASQKYGRKDRTGWDAWSKYGRPPRD
jgi:hypothetical protein